MKEEMVEENTGKTGRSGCRPAPAEGVDPIHPLTWQQVGTQTIPKPLPALASREPVPAAAGQFTEDEVRRCGHSAKDMKPHQLPERPLQLRERAAGGTLAPRTRVVTLGPAPADPS